MKFFLSILPLHFVDVKDLYFKGRKLCDLNLRPFELNLNLSQLQVLERLYKSNVRNFTIYYDKHNSLLFSHMEYIGKYNTMHLNTSC